MTDQELVDALCNVHVGDTIRLTAAQRIQSILFLLQDDLYDSKDWQQGDMLERVHWLIAMLKSKSEEVDAWVKIANENVDRIAELEGSLSHLYWQAVRLRGEQAYRDFAQAFKNRMSALRIRCVRGKEE